MSVLQDFSRLFKHLLLFEVILNDIEIETFPFYNVAFDTIIVEPLNVRTANC